MGNQKATTYKRSDAIKRDDSVDESVNDYKSKAFNKSMFDGLSSYAALNHLTIKDLNRRRFMNEYKCFYNLYTKDDIQKYLAAPGKYQKQLRRAIRYIYGASTHFRRLIQYFTGLTDLSYVVEPYKINPKKANKRTLGNNYRRVLNMIASMNIKTQLPKIITVCLREDICFLTAWLGSDNITLQHLPSDYCAISSIEGNVLNVTFNFSYFTSHPDLLQYYPEEFRIKYEIFKKNPDKPWMELDSPTSFAIKCNSDILDYPLPPFAGLLRELYDIEDYAKMKLTKTALENYAMLVMQIPMDSDGNWGIDLKKARDFWSNLDDVTPEEVGSVLSPMEIKKISFERSNVGDVDTIADAEQHMFTAAGVSSLIFNNEKASANALLLSIKADQAITYGIVCSIEDALNRLIQAQSFGKNFKINFLDVSTYNRKEAGDAYLKAASYGMPTISAYAASQGIDQASVDSMSFLEGTVLGLQDMFVPLRNSAQMSGDVTSSVESRAATDEGGAPTKDIGELTDSGEQNREDGDDW